MQRILRDTFSEHGMAKVKESTHGNAATSIVR